MTRTDRDQDGPPGKVVAGRCAAEGMPTAIVEAELIGGECSYWFASLQDAVSGPGTSSLQHAATRRVPGAADAVTGSIDGPKAFAQRDAMTSNWHDGGQLPWLADDGTEPVRGRARLAGERTVNVTQPDNSIRRLNGDNGRRRDGPPRRGHLRPSRACARPSGGTTARSPSRDHVRAAFEAEGITVALAQKVVSATRRAAGALVTATFDDGRQITADEILVAVARRPRTRDIGLGTVGLGQLVDRTLATDDRLRIRGAAEWLYAVGGCNGKALHTHMGKYGRDLE